MQGETLNSIRVGSVLLFAGAMAAFAQAPSVANGGVLNAASFDRTQPVASGSLVSIFGTNLATSLSQADSIPLSNKLGDTTVTFNNIPAPLLFVNHDAANGDQINAQLPWEIQGGTAQVVVTKGGVASAPVSFQVNTGAPGLFAVNFGTGQAIAYGNSDGLLAAAPGAIPGLNTHAAKIGDQTTLVLLATGLGPVTGSVQTGDIVRDGALHTCINTPTVLVGGVKAQVAFAGLTPQFVGVYQINIVIQPGTPTGNAVPVQIQSNGITTTDKITIAVSQ